MPDILEYLSGVGPLELIGVGGFLCYFFAFGAVQFGRLDGNSAIYSVANIVAAVLVSISILSEFNLSSALIQGSWIVIGLVGGDATLTIGGQTVVIAEATDLDLNGVGIAHVRGALCDADNNVSYALSAGSVGGVFYELVDGAKR